MAIADPRTYLRPICDELRKHWPANRAVNIVCHGHSVPAGYFATPRVDAANAYPRLLHDGLLARFPFAVVNVVVTAIGGEHSVQGAARFAADVLAKQPDVVTIDYALNDRGIGLDAARAAWTDMIRAALVQGARVLLLTPTGDLGEPRDGSGPLGRHADLVRALAAEHGVGMVDSLAAFAHHPGEPSDLMSWSNHPNRAGHELVARELLRWFPPA
jgi:acyl-CoA thioesterase-1